jgi:hypothetical protein
MAAQLKLIDEVVAFSRDYVNNRSHRTGERKAKIKEALTQLTGEKLKFGCSTCYIEALFKILNLTKMATPKGYELKKGVLLQAFGHPEKVCTNLTLTDELAEWYLKYYPEKAIYFAKIPAMPDPAKVIIVPPVVIDPIVAPEEIKIPDPAPEEKLASEEKPQVKEPKKIVKRSAKAKK